MNALAMLVVLLAVVAVMLLWKLLVTAAGIGGAQWLLLSTLDSPAAEVLVFGVPALLLALVFSHGLPRRLLPTRTALPGRRALAAGTGAAR